MSWSVTRPRLIYFLIPSDGKKLNGLQHFFGHEILSVEVIDDDIKTGKKKKSIGPGLSEVHEPGPRMLKEKHLPAHLKKLQTLDTKDILMKYYKPDPYNPSCSEEKLSEAKRYMNNLSRASKSSDYDSSTDSDGNDETNEMYTVIDKIGKRFQNAISCIQHQSIISVAMEGICIGREGKLCWLQIATKEHLILFDMLSLGQAGFEEGLKDVFEDADILKIMHDCRLPSDLLFHQFNVKIVNLFDTQVADVFVYRLKHNGSWSRYVQGLPHCLFQHLQLSPEQVHIMRVRASCKKEDQQIWAERPPPKCVLDAAAKNVIYLMDLRMVLMEKMLSEYAAGVDIYLDYVKDASENDAKRCQETSHLLPYAFQDLQHFVNTERFRGRSLRKVHLLGKVQKDEHGFEENCPGYVDPYVRASHDSIWHESVDPNSDLRRRQGQRSQSLGRDNKPSVSLNGSSSPRKQDLSSELSVAEKPEDICSCRTTTQSRADNADVLSFGNNDHSHQRKSSTDGEMFPSPGTDSAYQNVEISDVSNSHETRRSFKGEASTPQRKTLQEFAAKMRRTSKSPDLSDTEDITSISPVFKSTPKQSQSDVSPSQTPVSGRYSTLSEASESSNHIADESMAASSGTSKLDPSEISVGEYLRELKKRTPIVQLDDDDSDKIVYLPSGMRQREGKSWDFGEECITHFGEPHRSRRSYVPEYDNSDESDSIFSDKNISNSRLNRSKNGMSPLKHSPRPERESTDSISPLKHSLRLGSQSADVMSPSNSDLDSDNKSSRLSRSTGSPRSRLQGMLNILKPDH